MLKWLVTLMLFLFIVLPVRYAIERVKPFEKRNRDSQVTTDLKKLNDKGFSKGVLFNYGEPIEAMFYTDLTAYSQIPDKETIIGLMQKGYTVIINDDGNVPEEIKAVNGIIYVTVSAVSSPQ